MDVHTRQLQYFIAVAEELSFTRAAQRLHVSQQGLSTQIKQLEHTMDVVLFARTTRLVELTAAGAVFLQDLRDTLSSLDAAVDRARSVHRGEQDRLVLGAMEGAALTLTEPILDAFRKRHPGVTVELRHFTYEDPSAGLKTGSVDVAFTRRPFLDDGVRFERLFTEPLIALLPTGHRLADREVVHAWELLDEALLGAMTTDPVWNAFWEMADYREGRPAPVVSRSNSLLEELHKVATGVGVVLTVACARWIPFPGVRMVPVADLPPNEVAVGWRAAQESPLVRSFVEVALTVRDAHPELVAQLQEPDFADCTVPPHL
ncbi:LysR family transcriptional regulator [Nocardia amikacinitolerans]|uniref:LysR family transcriptional regulator n=1 Tax=Nocardia amikacinitolerans TaxID=756689 RepID=UPI0020A3022D|nr:LysR substrate-binding domain-containing protein [Nocardia amikacinitolerans]MCP2290788.1 DNA-binding transcriptional regulator, LysR family [Nocardia amikacinitolerans]